MPDRPATDVRRVARREVLRNQWLTLYEDEIAYADGSPGTYTVVDKRDFAVVLAFTGGGFWLVEQYRYALGRRAWEFPQGGWPSGKSGTPEELAAAELVEETGLRADTLEHLGRLDASPGFATNGFDVYLATGLHEGEPDREASEADMVHRWFPTEELHAMLARGEFTDSNSVAALALFLLRSPVQR
ncbi:MAG TPA: NUDIX hydrolase [Jatrophihabitans sp.]|jgi:8-oxo-dGTP pyrophosphatase MutT (NUDIX family)